MKNNCFNCSNAVGADWCTMQKDMNLAKYKKCKFHKIIPKKPKPKPVAPRKRIFRVLKDEEYSSRFLRFVKKGGHYSFRTGRFAPE